MRPYPKRRRRSAVALLLALPWIVPACDQTDVAAPLPAVTVEVMPSGPVDLTVGSQLQLEARVVNGSSQAVSYTSSAPQVASVSAGGLITAHAAGTATVTIRSVAYPDRAIGILVRVTPVSVPPTREPSVLIESVRRADGSLVVPTEVSGEVFVRLAVERGAAELAEVLLNGTVACSQSIGSTEVNPVTGALQLVCLLNTARFDTITGAPTFPNGVRILSARLLDAEGTVVAGATGMQLVLQNSDRLFARVRPEREAVDSEGHTWWGGAIEVEVLPVVYQPGSEVARVSARLQIPGAGELQEQDDAAPFRLVFAERSLQGVLTDSLRLRVTSAMAGGQTGPGLELGPFRYDAVPPAAGVFHPREWLGEEVSFSSLHSAPPSAQDGVGGVTVRFFAGPHALSTADLLHRGTVQRGADLPASEALAYRVVAEVCDALANCALIEGFRFGVDREPPRIASVNLPDRVINPNADLSVSVVDDRSGFTARPLLVAVEALIPGTNSSCGPFVEGIQLPGRTQSGACRPDSAATIVPVPRVTAGYYDYHIVVVDRAGNRSEPIRRTVLLDRTAPTVVSVSAPAQGTPGSSLLVSAEVRDNLDLHELYFSTGFPGIEPNHRSVLGFAPVMEIGTPFDGSLVAARPASANLPFVRSLTYGSGAPASRTTVLSDSVVVRVTDAAGLQALQSVRLPDTPGASTADPLPLVAGTALQLSNATICTLNCLPSDATSTTISFRINGTLDLGQPFDRIYFFRLLASGQARLIGSTTAFRRDDVGTVRSYTYTFTYAPTAGLEGSYVVFAVGVMGGTARAGAALRSDDGTVTLVRR
jgi:hypothetical protein